MCKPHVDMLLFCVVVALCDLLVRIKQSNIWLLDRCCQWLETWMMRTGNSSVHLSVVVCLWIYVHVSACVGCCDERVEFIGGV